MGGSTHKALRSRSNLCRGPPGIPAHLPFPFGPLVAESAQNLDQLETHQRNASASGTLEDVRITTSSEHYEPQLQAHMTEKAFALSIAQDYISSWSRFTQAGIASYRHAIVYNHPDAAMIQSFWLPEKRKYLEQALPMQFEQMRRQISEGDELQVRRLVDWIRKEKRWEREHGWTEDVDMGSAQAEYRHLLPWMQGAMVNPPQGRDANAQTSVDGGEGSVGEFGSWDWGGLY